MPIETQWLVEGKIIHVDAIGTIGIDEIKEASQRISDMFTITDAPLVHILTNETSLDSLPISLKLFSDAAEFMRHPQVGWVIMYGSDNPLSKFRSTVITGITKVRHRRFHTLEETLEFLVSVDKSLPSVEEIQ